MRVIVTGGAGFIDSAPMRHLALRKGFEVLNIDALTYAGNLSSLREVEGHANYRFLKANICDQAARTEAITSFAPDRLMHLAAEGHVDRSITGAGDPTRAVRPANSRMSWEKLATEHGVRLPNWQTSMPLVVERLVRGNLQGS